MRKTMMLAAMLALTVLMMAASPAMANDDNDRNHHNNDRFFVNDFNRFDDDFFFDNGFQDSELEAESGDIDQSFVVSGTGSNSNQCVGINGTANTGNAQNITGVTQFDDNGFFFDDDFNRFDDDFFFDDDFDNDFDFEDGGASIDVSGGSATTTCDQQVNQAAAAG